MASTIVAQVLGLQTANNIHSTGPAGTLAVAKNVVLNHTNLLEPARGWSRKAYGFGVDTDRAAVLAYYGTTLLVQYAEKLARDTGSAFTDYSGTFAPADATLARMRFVEAAGNVYFNCADGTRVLTSSAGTPEQAGVPKAIRVTALNRSGQGWQTPNTAVRYRAVWGIIDANGNEKLGVPSGPYVLRNYIHAAIGYVSRTAPDGSHPAGKVTVVPSGPETHGLSVGDTVVLTPGEANFAAGTKTVVTSLLASFTYDEAGANTSNTVAQDFEKTRSASVTVNIPAGITTSHFYRLYRSDESATASTPPDDELFLVYEGQPTAGELVTGYLTVTDLTPSDFNVSAADPLYTNTNTGHGELSANERPPICLDMSTWDGRAWLANTTQRHRMEMQLLGVGSPAGAQNNDTLVIGGRTYTFKTVAAVATDVFLYTTYTPALNIELTARYICAVINNDSSSVVYAHYVSGDDDNPGRILLEEIAIGGSSFTVTASRVLSFNPSLPRTSDSNARPHGLMYSKPGQPDSVPLVNEVLVGAKNSAILRVAPLRGSLIVFKKDGIWTVTGTNGNYATERIAVAKLLSPETVVFFSDRIWALTNQGIINVTESAGVAVVSRPVESDITDLFGSLLGSVKLNSFAVGYESERRFLCWLPSDTEIDYATGAFNYSTATQSWTTLTKAATCGVMDPDADRLVLGSADSNTVLVERKELTTDDYMDEGFSAEIASFSGVTVVLVDASDVEVGDRLDDGAVHALVTAVDVDSNELTLLSEEDWTVGAATVYQGIPIVVEWNPVSSDNPALCKMHRQLTWLFKNVSANLFVSTFNSELVPAQSEVEMTFDGYGSGGYGEPDWGNTSAKSRRVAPLPRNHGLAAQISIGFRLREAGSRFQLQGWVLEHEPDSEKGSRR